VASFRKRHGLSATLAGPEPSDPDGQLGDTETLLRYIPEVGMTDDGKPMSGMFKEPEFSVDRASLKPLPQFREEHSEAYVIEFSAADARQIGYKVQADPILNDPDLPDNRAHAKVTNEHGPTERLRMAKRLRDLVKTHPPAYVPLRLPSPGRRSPQ